MLQQRRINRICRRIVRLAALALLGVGIILGHALGEARPFVYVARSNNTVAVIDGTTHAVVATVPVGPSPNSIAITPNGKHAYVTNNGSDTVSVIDTGSNTV